MRVLKVLAAAFVAVALIVPLGPAPPVAACDSCAGLPEVAAQIFNCAVPEPTIIVDLSEAGAAGLTVLVADADHFVISSDAGTIRITRQTFAADTHSKPPALSTHGDPTAPANPDLLTATTGSPDICKQLDR